MKLLVQQTKRRVRAMIRARRVISRLYLPPYVRKPRSKPMRAILRFGVRGGIPATSTVIPNAKLAAKLAAKLVAAFTQEPCETNFLVSAKRTRSVAWTSSTHFVSVTVLDSYEIQELQK